MGFAEATKKAGETDEWNTPESAVYPLLPYIKSLYYNEDGTMKEPTIWCPFDDENSAFWKVFSPRFKTIATHINTGNDFFTTNVEECDYIISNPPYSIRQKVLERLFDLKKPFAMLLNYAGLWDSKARYNLFKKMALNYLFWKVEQSLLDLTKQTASHYFNLFMCVIICCQKG